MRHPDCPSNGAVPFDTEMQDRFSVQQCLYAICLFPQFFCTSGRSAVAMRTLASKPCLKFFFVSDERPAHSTGVFRTSQKGDGQVIVLLSRTADASETVKRCTQGLFVWRLHVELTTVGQFAVSGAFRISRTSPNFTHFLSENGTSAFNSHRFFAREGCPRHCPTVICNADPH